MVSRCETIKKKLKFQFFGSFFCIRLISLLLFLLFFVIESFMYLVLGLFPVKILFRKMNIGQGCGYTQLKVSIQIFWYILNPRQEPEGSYKIGSVRPFICNSVCSGLFLELYHQFFLNFSMLIETYIKLCVTQPNFLQKSFLPPKLVKWDKNGLKTVF